MYDDDDDDDDDADADADADADDKVTTHIIRSNMFALGYFYNTLLLFT